MKKKSFNRRFMENLGPSYTRVGIFLLVLLYTLIGLIILALVGGTIWSIFAK